MDRGYKPYRLIDRIFDDSPKVALSDGLDFEIARRTVSEGWRRPCIGKRVSFSFINSQDLLQLHNLRYALWARHTVTLRT